MSEINEGGAAFPVSADNMQSLGMSLRDYFAAKAMSGYMVGTAQPNAVAIAETAYEVADAMLAAREVK